MSHLNHVRFASAPPTAAQLAIATYTALYEDMAETAQLYAGTHLGPIVASLAMQLLVAADAEQNDPEPSLVRDCSCTSCRVYRILADKGEPALERLS